LAALLGAAFPGAQEPGMKHPNRGNLVGPRLKSDDGAVVMRLSAQGLVVEHDKCDGLTEELDSTAIVLPVYNAAMSPDGSATVFFDRWCRLRVLIKADGLQGKCWLFKELQLPAWHHSCTRLAVTNDEEAERIMSLRLLRDVHTRDQYAPETLGPVLLVVARENLYPYDGSSGAVRYQIAGIDLVTKESVSLQDCNAQRSPRKRQGGPLLTSLLHPEEVVERLSRIMPLAYGKRRMGRSICLSEPPQFNC